jgi:hypothetical protein
VFAARASRGLLLRAAAVSFVAALAACRSAAPPPPPAPPAPPPAEPTPAPTPPVAQPYPLPTTPPQDPLLVRPAALPIQVRAWAEPSRLPPGGGSAQILVRVTKKGGAPVEGVEVRLATSAGSLFSDARVMVTDARGMTRDRLTTSEPAVLTLNAGGTRVSFSVDVGARPE